MKPFHTNETCTAHMSVQYVSGSHCRFLSAAFLCEKRKMTASSEIFDGCNRILSQIQINAAKAQP